MNSQYKSIVLFTPPRLAEEGKTFWPGMQSFGQRAVASAQGGIGLGRLGEVQAVGPSGNAGNDILAQLHNNFIDLVDSFTGAKGQRDAQANAITLAQLQAQQSAYEAQQRTIGWSKAAPWLAVGAAVLGAAVVVAATRR